MRYEHPRVILTGASSGIGRATALELARRGARLVLTARREGLLREVADDVVRLGGQAVVLAADAVDADTPARLLSLVDESYGGVDIVIMNAGMDVAMFSDTFDIRSAERVMDVNFTAPMRMIAAVLPRMIADRRGHLVAIDSLAGKRGMPGAGPYCASKAALDRLMESLRVDLRGSGVRMTTIFPGFVRTGIVRKNEFAMPFTLDVDDAARRIVRAVERGRREYSFPLPTALIVRLSRLLPNAVYDWIASSFRPRPSS